MFTLGYRCWLCQQPLVLAQHGICSCCLTRLPTLPTCCPRCGLPTASSFNDCGRCILEPPPWQHLVAVSDYQPPLKGLISQFKFYQQEQLAPALARLVMLSWLNARRTRLLPKPDRLIPVPLHGWRHWRRGFNQTELITKPLAHWIGCRWSPTDVVRRRATAVQSRLSAAARKHNLKQAFSCRQSVQNQHIALIDDVVTTGSTVAEISKLLLTHGAASIQIWCICRTL